MWSPKFPLPFFQIKVTTRVKNASYGRFYAQKWHYFRSQYQRATVRVRVLFFFHKLLFGDIKLSDLDRSNRKLSAHDCNDHIKTLFSSHNCHETRNINTSQAAMCLVPGHNCATLLAKVHRVHNLLTIFQLWKTTWRLGNVQLVLIVAVVEVLLQEYSFHF